MGIIRHVLWRHSDKNLHHLLEQIIFTKAIDKIHTGSSASNIDHMIDQIKVGINIQLLAKIMHIDIDIPRYMIQSPLHFYIFYDIIQFLFQI